MYKNSLIIRASITQRPFVHKKAFGNVKINFMYQDEAAKIIFKLINKKGVINLGGRAQTIFNFAKKSNPKVKKISAKNKLFPNNLTMNLSKLKKII
jgi:dTDP-4-dehydrorhamnose reductase